MAEGFERGAILGNGTPIAICNSSQPTVVGNLSRKSLDIGDER
jgi:hypothetical protein